MKNFFVFLFMGLCSIITCFGQVYTTSSHVEILEGHTWYAGKILAVKGDKYKIHYNMYDNDIWDIWIEKDHLRLSNLKDHPVNNKPVSGNGVLYSGSSATGGNVYLYFYPSGHVVRGCPRGGLEKFNYNVFCGSGSNSCGTFTKNAGSISIRWSQGGNWQGTIKPNGDMEINSSLYGVMKKVPNKLSANYEFTLNSGGISIAEVIKFKEDGSYAISRASGYDNNDGKNSAEWQSNSKGKYVINGYTLTMTNNAGKVESHSVYSLDSTKNPDFLGWDGNFLSKGGK